MDRIPKTCSCLLGLLLLSLLGCIDDVAAVEEEELDARGQDGAPLDAAPLDGSADAKVPDAGPDLTALRDLTRPDVTPDSTALRDVAPLDAAPDSTPDAHLGEACEVFVEGREACRISRGSLMACDDFARCICEDDPGCVQGLVVPRGAITLADFCFLSGTELRSLREAFAELALPISAWRVTGTSAACAEVPAWTVHGETLSWSLSTARAGVRLAHPVEAEDLEPPLLDLEGVDRLWLAEGRIQLTEAAAREMEASLEALRGRDCRVGERPGLIAHWVRAGDPIEADQVLAQLEGLEDGGGRLDLRRNEAALDLSALGFDAAILSASGRVVDLPCLGDAGCLSGRCVQARCTEP